MFIPPNFMSLSGEGAQAEDLNLISRQFRFSLRRKFHFINLLSKASSWIDFSSRAFDYLQLIHKSHLSSVDQRFHLKQSYFEKCVSLLNQITLQNGNKILVKFWILEEESADPGIFFRSTWNGPLGTIHYWSYHNLIFLAHPITPRSNSRAHGASSFCR